MAEQTPTRAELVAENEALRRRVAELAGEGNTRPPADRTHSREELEMLAEVIEQSVTAVAVLTVERVFTFVNAAYLEDHDVARSDVVGKRWGDFTSRGSSFEGRTEEIYTCVVKDGLTWRGEVSYADDAGAVTWYHATFFPLRDRRGAVTHVVYISRDITAHRLAAAAVRDSEERFRRIVESSPMGMHIYTLHEDGRLVFSGANPAADRILGVENEQFVGMTLEEAFPSLAESEVPVRYRAAAADGTPWRTEQVNTDEGGIAGTFEVTAVQIDVSQMIAVFQDITERKRGEEALRRSEEQFRLLAENVTDVIWTMDTRLRFTFVSPSILQLRGYTVEEVMTQSLTDTMVPESIGKTMEILATQMQRAGAGDEAAWEPVTFEVEQPCKDGTTVFTSNNAKVIWGADNSVEMIVGVTHDITERRRAEEEKARLEDQLHHAQKMEAIGRLAGGVAHDFNNVLCAITGNAELAMQELPVASPVHQLLADIDTAAGRASDLTRQLLAFSRKQIIEPRVVDMSQIIESLHSMLARLIGEDIILQTMPTEGIWRTRVDPGQFEQIVLNLVINARDAMPDGGRLVVETMEIFLDDDYCRLHAGATPGDNVMLAVSDTGSGMTPEVREMIFEPFFTTKQLGQGTGLGLATVFGIVDQSQGRIEVYSEPGQGTTFKVYFPRVADEIETITSHGATRPVGGRDTILVVEDEEIVRTLVVKLLTRLGYSVLATSSGQEAIALAREHDGAIDLLLTDVVMPGMNGRELAQRLSAQRPGIRVLYTSGYTHNVIAHHGVLDEGVQFISKPYSIDTLAARVREALE